MIKPAYKIKIIRRMPVHYFVFIIQVIKGDIVLGKKISLKTSLHLGLKVIAE